MEKRLNVYVFNQLKSTRLNLNQNDGYLLSRLVNLESQLISGEIKIESVAQQLFDIFEIPNREFDLARVCIALLTPFSRRLAVLSSYNSEALGSNTMGPGYSCYIGKNSSLLGLQESDLRICRDLGVAIESFRLEGRPVQRSLQRLFDMGVRSGLTMSCRVGELGVGYLFFNSKIVSRFDAMTNSQVLFLATLKLLLKSIIYRRFNQMIMASQRLPNHRSSELGEMDLVVAETFAQKLKSYIEQNGGQQIEVRMNSNLQKPILFSAQSLIFLLSEVIRSQYEFRASSEIRVDLNLSDDQRSLTVICRLTAGHLKSDRIGLSGVASLFAAQVNLQRDQFELTVEVPPHDAREIECGYSL
jgi:hypothetical protein